MRAVENEIVNNISNNLRWNEDMCDVDEEINSSNNEEVEWEADVSIENYPTYKNIWDDELAAEVTFVGLEELQRSNFFPSPNKYYG